MENKVSIIVPAYNVEQYIEKCINSICNQTHKNIEIILVDDGSTDNTGLICDKLANEDSRIKVIHKENQGVSAARNDALEAATGDYLAFVDADDYVSDIFIEKLVEKMQDCDLSICGFKEEYCDKTLVRTVGESKMLTGTDALSMLFDEDKFRGYLWNKMFKRSIVEDSSIRFDLDISVWEDVLFVFDYLARCERVYYSTKPLYMYVYRDTSASHGEKDLKKAYSAIMAKEKMLSRDMVLDDNVAKKIYYRLVTSSLTVQRIIAMISLDSIDSEFYEEKSAYYIHKYGYKSFRYLSRTDRISTLLCYVSTKLFRMFYMMAHS